MKSQWRFLVCSGIVVATMLAIGARSPGPLAGNTDYAVSLLPAGPGWTFSGANDMNDGGVFVGPAWNVDADGYTTELRALRWASRKDDPVALSLPDGFTVSSALQVNNSGDIAGWIAADVAYTDHHAARWDKFGAVTDVHPDGYWLSELWAINKHGDATGVAIDDAMNYDPFVWPADGDPEELPLDESAYIGGWGNSIDKNGNVAGEAYQYDENGTIIAHAVVWMADGTFIDLHEDLCDAIDADVWQTRAWMASDDGTIAGHAFGPDQDWVVPWVWTESAGVVLLDADGHAVGDAWGLAGQAIVGLLDGWTYGGYTYASTAIWTPRTVRGQTIWTLILIPPPEGATGLAACNGNTHGDVCGAIVKEDGTIVPFVAHK